MKSIAIRTILTLCPIVLLSFGCLKGYSDRQLQETPEQRILGSWVLENNFTTKMVFLANGEVKTYHRNQLKSTDYYSVTRTCDGETDGLFLKIIDKDDGTVNCAIINGINENGSGILSLTTSYQGKVIILVRP